MFVHEASSGLGLCSASASAFSQLGVKVGHDDKFLAVFAHVLQSLIAECFFVPVGFALESYMALVRHVHGAIRNVVPG